MSGPRRAFVVVLDACGAGALPDAERYGDAGTNTLAHLAHAVGGLELPTLEKLGLGNALELDGVPPSAAPVLHGRLGALGPGKDTTCGHWELMGVVAEEAPTYPNGFPAAVLEPLRAATGIEVLCNRVCDGLEAIDRYGAEHLESGQPILYTSQDSVFQLAAHVDVMPERELYALCGEARRLLRGEHEVRRVIARPFAGEPGAFRRTHGRRDFASEPPARSYLDELAERGIPVHAVGKVAQVFAGRGISEEHRGSDNAEAIAATSGLIEMLEEGLVFANLVDTDQVYGHRKDVHGFHAALQEIDVAVAGWLERLGPADMLVLTADHGCDPSHPLTEHTREHAPLLATFEGHGGRRFDGPLAAVGASVLEWLAGPGARPAPSLPGVPFLGSSTG